MYIVHMSPGVCDEVCYLICVDGSSSSWYLVYQNPINVFHDQINVINYYITFII